MEYIHHDSEFFREVNEWCAGKPDDFCILGIHKKPVKEVSAHIGLCHSTEGELLALRCQEFLGDSGTTC